MQRLHLHILCLNLLFWPALLHAQYDPEAKIDPLGRPYRPVVGILKTVVQPNIPADVANYLSIAFSNGAKGNAHTPYGVVDKSNLKSAVTVFKRKSSEERREMRFSRWYGESVGTEYLLQLEILHFNYIVTTDTIKQPRPELRKVYNFYANLTARLIDVTTTKVLSYNNFNVQSNSRGLRPQPGKSDSLQALQNLYAAAKAEAPRMLNRLVTGVAQITEIKEEKKDKAETVLLSNSPLTLGPQGETLPVYVLQETFETPLGKFLHAEQIANTSKPSDFNYKERNYAIRRGGKDVAAQFKAGKVLVASKGALPPRRPMPDDGRRSVVLDVFKNQTAAPGFQVRMLEDACGEYLAARPQLIDMVDREVYALIEAERKMQSLNLSDASQGGVSIGAEYLLAADVTKLEIKREVITKPKEEPKTAENTKTDSAKKPAAPAGTGADRPAATKTQTTEQPKAKEKPPAVEKPVFRFVEMVNSGIRVNAVASVDLRLVNIQTGEIIWNSTINAGASKDYPYDLQASAKSTQDEEIVKALSEEFARNAGPAAYSVLRIPTPVLKIVDTSKDEARSVLIGSGQQAGNWNGQAFEIVEVTEEVVDGQPLKREEVIAALKADLIYPETTLCKVRKGEKELLAKFNAGSTLYCRVTK